MGNTGAKIMPSIKSDLSLDDKLLNVYQDYVEFPLNGLIMVTTKKIVNYNAINGKIVFSIFFNNLITASDFNQERRIIVVGLDDQSIIQLSTNPLEVKFEIKFDAQVKEKLPIRITSICASRKEDFFVGFNNGITKKYNYFETNQNGIYVPAMTMSNSNSTLQVQNVFISQMFLILYITYILDNSIYLGMFSITTASQIKMLPIDFSSILGISIIESKKALLCLVPDSKILFINALDGKVITSIQMQIPQNAMPHKFVTLPITEQIQHIYLRDSEIPSELSDDSIQGICGDILFLALKDGSVLCSIISIIARNEKLNISWKPHKLYSLKKESSAQGSYCTSLIVSPITDMIIIGENNGCARIIEGSIKSVINPNQASKPEQKPTFILTALKSLVDLKEYNPKIPDMKEMKEMNTHEIENNNIIKLDK